MRDPRLPEDLRKPLCRLDLKETSVQRPGTGVRPAEPEPVEDETLASQRPADPFREIAPEGDSPETVVEEDDRGKSGAASVRNDPGGLQAALGKPDREGHSDYGGGAGQGHRGILASGGCRGKSIRGVSTRHRKGRR